MSDQSRVFWGQHIVIDLAGCPRERLTDANHIASWSAEVILAIDMRAYGEPILEHFADHNVAVAGYTLVQLIETSALSAHFAENRGEVYIDLFSCKRFAEEIVLDISKRYFEPSGVTVRSLIRGPLREVADQG